MSVEEAKKRRIAAVAAEKVALHDELERIAVTSIERYNALRIPGVVEFRIGSDVRDGYCDAERVWREQRTFQPHRIVEVKSFLWSALLNTGVTVVQCANRADGPNMFGRYVVFYDDGPVSTPLIECFRPMLSDLEAKYKHCIVMPRVVDGNNREVCQRVNAFYEVCPRRMLLLLAMMLQKTTMKLKGEFDPPRPHVTVLDVMPGWHATDRVHPKYTVEEKVIRSLTYTPITEEDSGDYDAVTALLSD